MSNETSFLTPCDRVRESCRYIMNSPACNVKIDPRALEKCAEQLHAKVDATWDAEEWHYTAKSSTNLKEKRERIALYILALDTINFCFWPTTTPGKINSLEYDDLAKALTEVAEQDGEYFFSAQSLATMTQKKFTTCVQSLLKPIIPNAPERVRLWNEIGRGLLELYNGSAMELIQDAQGSAPKLVHLILCTFPGFRDEALWQERHVCIYKRAQILVGDWNAALNLDLNEMDKLTMFADYRVPQVLRHFGVLVYKEDLKHTVDAGHEIAASSIDELSIRAATVVAVEKIVFYIREKFDATTISDVTLDWYLWQLGEEMRRKGEMKPHHKTRTIFY